MLMIVRIKKEKQNELMVCSSDDPRKHYILFVSSQAWKMKVVISFTNEQTNFGTFLPCFPL